MRAYVYAYICTLKLLAWSKLKRAIYLDGFLFGSFSLLRGVACASTRCGRWFGCPNSRPLSCSAGGGVGFCDTLSAIPIISLRAARYSQTPTAQSQIGSISTSGKSNSIGSISIPAGAGWVFLPAIMFKMVVSRSVLKCFMIHFSPMNVMRLSNKLLP